MASGSVLTLGGSITHGISGERPVGSESIADPDGHVSQACLLYNVDRSLLLAAEECQSDTWAKRECQ